MSELEALDDVLELSELDALDETEDDSEELTLLDSDELADSLDDTDDDSDELTELETLELSELESLDEKLLDSEELNELDSAGNSIPVTMIGWTIHWGTLFFSRWISVSCCVTSPRIFWASTISLSISDPIMRFS